MPEDLHHDMRHELIECDRALLHSDPEQQKKFWTVLLGVLLASCFLLK